MDRLDNDADLSRPEYVRGTGLRIGVMGGTFDPIHYGHLLAAEEARSRIGLSEVVFVPTGHPPHKDASRISSPEDRFKMTSLAVAGNGSFKVSRIEIDTPGPHHTVDTILALKTYYSQDVSFYFITGLDSMLQLLTWKEPFVLASLCTLVAVSRPGYNVNKLLDLPEQIQKSILPLEIPLLAISSTDIRRRLREGLSIRYLTPDGVINYILSNRLYI
ncbi:MAG: nicotinate-nucleotide adenylyltransferase [Thermanaerothrix sp.]|nr:nicotinate-nucleotide adenylyltransferase [Thermanaerothrix sp.]